MNTLVMELEKPIPKKVINEVGYELNRLDSCITRVIIEEDSPNQLYVWYLPMKTEKQIREIIMDYFSSFKAEDEKDEEIKPRAYFNRDLKLIYASKDVSDITGCELLWINKDGQVVLGDKLIRLRKNLDKKFMEMGIEYDVCELSLPTFMPKSFFEKNWYFLQYPNHIVFPMTLEENSQVINSFKDSVNPKTGKVEEIKPYLGNTKEVLSPATCFHIHNFIEEHPETLDKYRHFTAVSNCFRYESTNTFTIERTNTFHMRELVFYGPEKEVDSILENYGRVLAEMLNKWKIKGLALDANDPFYMRMLPEGTDYYLPKVKKWEIRLELPYSNSDMACASFNRHGNFFLKNAGAITDDKKDWVSGCMAFGLERWIWAILCQHGTDIDKWPEEIRKMAEQD